MRKLIVILVLCPFIGQTQTKFGIKAGINFANVTNASSIKGSNTTGFMGGVFISSKMGKIMARRTELIFSRQGYSFRTNTNTGKVNLNYILFSQMMGFNITKFVQVQVGAMTGYLLNAKADSSSNQSSGTSGTGMQGNGIMSSMNRVDYGVAGCVEIYPYKGLLVGARINISLASTFKNEPGSGNPSSFMPGVNAKNNVLQIYAGYRF